MLRYLILFILAMPVLPANANQYIQCVQEQLNSLSINAGSPDGVIGRKTKAALSQFVSLHPSFDKLPPISKATASIWCGKIGEENKLQGLWPSFNSSLQVSFLGRKPADVINYIDIQTRAAKTFIENKLDVAMIGFPDIFISSNSKKLSNQVYLSAGKIDNRDFLYQETKGQCKGQAFTGTSYDSILALCIHQSLLDSNSDFMKIRPWIKRIIAHELTHEIQGQYVGFYRHLGNKIRVKKRGPKWLSEAIATAVELSFAFPNTPMNNQLNKYKKRETYSGSKLKKYEDSKIVRGREFANYVGYAGVLLASEHSLSSFGKFWKATPKLGWRKAFEYAFNESIENFYTRFGTNKNLEKKVEQITIPKQGRKLELSNSKRELQLSGKSRQPTTCDVLAASPYSDFNITKAISFEDLQKDAKPAIVACEIALKIFPEDTYIQMQLARAYMAHKQYALAYKFFEIPARRGERVSRANLGVMYMHGLGTTKNEKKAEHLLKPLAEKGMDSAQANLGVLYYRGSPVFQNDEKAIYWLRKAASSKQAYAMWHLAKIYDEGNIVKADTKIAGLYLLHAYYFSLGKMKKPGFSITKFSKDTQLSLFALFKSAGVYHGDKTEKFVPLDVWKAFNLMKSKNIGLPSLPNRRMSSSGTYLPFAFPTHPLTTFSKTSSNRLTAPSTSFSLSRPNSPMRNDL